MESIRGVHRTIAVGSCKGGVGKTTISVNLALALRRSGYNVGLFDADLYGPNVPLMLGYRRRQSRFPFSGVASDGSSIPFIPLYRADKNPYVKPHRRFGLQSMSLGFWFSEESVASDTGSLGGTMVSQVLRDVQWESVDYLIIDLPPGTGDLLQVIFASIPMDGVVMVTTPHEMALLDTARSVRQFKQFGVKIIGKILNMSHLICPKCGERIEMNLGNYEEQSVLSELDLLGSVPLDPAFARTIDASHPLLQKEITNPSAVALCAVANRIVEMTTDAQL